MSDFINPSSADSEPLNPEHMPPVTCRHCGASSVRAPAEVGSPAGSADGGAGGASTPGRVPGRCGEGDSCRSGGGHGAGGAHMRTTQGGVEILNSLNPRS